MIDLVVVKDIAAIASPIIAPAIGAAVAIRLYRLKYREVIDCYVDWGFRGHPPDERPFLVVHNRSDRSVAIKSVEYLSGFPFRKRDESTALDYDNPDDLDFPYVVAPDATRWLAIDDIQARRLVRDCPRLVQWLTHIGRSRIVLQFETMGKTKTTISAERVIPWDMRPTWARR